MRDQLISLYYKRTPKAELILFCRKNKCWTVLKELCFNRDKLVSWRSAWLLNELSPTELQTMNFDCKLLIRHARWNDTSVQREVFKLMGKLEVPEADSSGYLDWAVETWLAVENPSSLRIVALRRMIEMGKNYPDLNREIAEMGGLQFTKSLSPGIRAQAIELFHQLELPEER